MSWAEYKKIEHTHPVPYIYKLQKGEKQFLYLGSHHSFDPSDSQFSQFSQFEQEFKEFKPEIVLTEGKIWPGKFPNAEEAIKAGAEMSFLSWLAHNTNIPTACFDASHEQELMWLQKKFSQNEIFAMCVLRAAQHGEKFMASEINFFQKLWPEYDCSQEHLEKLLANIFKRPIDITDKEFCNNATSPVDDFSILNKVAVESNVLRDTHMVKTILQMLQKHDRVLAIAGHSHAVIQEPELRKHFL